MEKINILSNGGFGDFILSERLIFLLNQIYPNKYDIINFFYSRDETFNMVKIVYPERIKNHRIQKLNEEDFFKITQKDLDNSVGRTYIIYPDKLFRGNHAFPLKDYNLTNFSVKQTRTLLGKWKPSNTISIAINSITAGYTYHSVPELAYQLAKTFPNKKIYLPLLITWNNKDVPKFNFPNPPDNLVIEVQPEFDNVFDILCKSEYLITTDNAMMHIAHDLGMPYLVLDPQYNIPACVARWRPYGDYNSIPISSLVEDIIDVVKTQLEIPETQMVEADRVWRTNKNWAEELIFKE